MRIDQDALAISSREFLDETVETFRKSDAAHVEQTGQRIRRIVAENAHKIRINSPDGIQILIQESKRRKKKSARKLFTEIPDLLKSLKPVILPSKKGEAANSAVAIGCKANPTLIFFIISASES